MHLYRDDSTRENQGQDAGGGEGVEEVDYSCEGEHGAC